MIRVRGNRDKLKAYLAKKGIETMIHYPVPIPLQPAYQSIEVSESNFRFASYFSKEILTLPLLN